VVPYFNPVGYRSHLWKLSLTMKRIRRSGIIDDVFLTGAGKSRPLGFPIAFWDTECQFMWHKERLVNLAVNRLPDRYEHIVWIDSDVLIGRDWSYQVAQAFERSRIVQCFRTARYRTHARTMTRTRLGWLHSGGQGGSAPGLAWGAHRSFFSDGPGLFDLALVGGGDTLLARTCAPAGPGVSTISWVDNWSAPVRSSFHSWVSAVDDWLAGSDHPRSVAVEADIEVLEHGPHDARRYAGRQTLLAGLSPEHHIDVRPSRVLRWTEMGKTRIEPAIRQYFHDRSEDD
jgi:hypothetical protein